MHLNDYAQLVNDWAKAKGWNDKETPVPEFIALAHTELSEALEEYRHGHMDLYYTTDEQGLQKPEGYGVELVDELIRVFHEAARRGIDLDAMFDVKMEYNHKRPYKHGGKVI